MVSMPVPKNIAVSSGFGPRWGQAHNGIDFACSAGTPIYAAADGVVIQGKDRTQGTVEGFSSWIWLDCQASEGVDLIYGHVRHPAIKVRAGDRVKAGQLIGESGNEGETTGPHLHFEVWGPPGRTGGTPRDPAVWLRNATYPAPPAKEPTVPSPTGDPVWLPDVLRAAGLTCDVYPGAFERGHGDFGSIWGIVIHHTGSFGETPRGIAQHPSLGLASQLHLDPKGKYTLCGVGIAWHAGAGAYPGIQANNANQVTIGIEAANDGKSGWSKEQYNAYVTGVAAILNKLGRDSSRVIGHKEWAGKSQGKPDPGLIDMADFRKAVAREQSRLKGASVPPAPVVNRIDQEAKLAAAWIGKRLTEGEKPLGADGLGRYADFEHGTIFWHPTIHRANGNAIAVPTHLLETWRAYGGVSHFLGYPVRRHTVIDGVGDIQAFQGGTLYRRYGYLGVPVRGEIGKQWAAAGYEVGKYGWPTSDEYIVQDFERGQLRWNRPTGA